MGRCGLIEGGGGVLLQTGFDVSKVHTQIQSLSLFFSLSPSLPPSLFLCVPSVDQDVALSNTVPACYHNNGLGNQAPN